MTRATYKTSFAVEERHAKRLGNLIEELYWPPPDAVSLTDMQDGNWLVEILFPEVPDNAALSVFIEEHTDASPEIIIEEIPEIDWVTRSQQRLHPVRAGRFTIHGSHDRHRVGRSLWNIEIDAGQAFGTAHHGSTLGCLTAIDDLAKREVIRCVLDMGTGTGVLAIAAARVWKATVLASDNDPLAVQVAGANASRNTAGSRVKILEAAGLNHPEIRKESPFDLVIANILARPLIDMAHGIASAVRPGRFVILSGITREQAGRVAASYRAAGFTHHRRITMSDWVTFTLRLKGRRN